MDIGAIIIIIIIGIILVLTFYVIGVYNTLLDARNKVKDKFTQVDNELKIRMDLTSSLVETVKKHVKHEEKILNELEKAKEKTHKANNINDKIQASNSMNKVLNKVLGLTESYPELKSNKKFNSLQKNLKEIEDKIDYAKSFYNDSVTNYNNLRKEAPANIIANIFKFNKIDIFK